MPLEFEGPLTGPTWPRRVQYQGQARTPAAPFAETVTEDRWHQPFSEPVRQRIVPRLAVALIASGLVYVEAAPFAETVTEDRWHQPFSEPVRTRRFPAAEQQALAWQPAPAPFVATGWFNWLTEPVRIKPRLPEGEQQVLALGPWPAISIGWYAPLTEPTRVRPKVLVPAYEQQFQPFDEDIIFVERWFAWWSEPVRVKPALAAASQQALAYDPVPFAVTIGWAPPLSEPVRVKPALRAALQPYEVSYDELPLPLVTGSGGWYLPDPTRPPDAHGEPRRKIKKPGAPREVAPQVAPPSFADVLAAQKPAQLADVLGSRFAPQVAPFAPAALDLYRPPVAAAAPAAAPLSIEALHGILVRVDAQDEADARRALEQLEQQEHERRRQLIAALIQLLGGGDNA